jgi:hypothetical protein
MCNAAFSADMARLCRRPEAGLRPKPIALRVGDSLFVDLDCDTTSIQYHLDRGGVLFLCENQTPGSLFDIGLVVVTAGAAAALADAGQGQRDFIARHVCGDWGDIGHIDRTELSEDKIRNGYRSSIDDEVNKIAVAKGFGQVMSQYRTTNGARLWVVTPLENGNVTYIMLPIEF